MSCHWHARLYSMVRAGCGERAERRHRPQALTSYARMPADQWDDPTYIRLAGAPTYHCLEFRNVLHNIDHHFQMGYIPLCF